ncbi:alginate biosynthesis protein Alg44 [Halomonas litopenaei]|uniref:Alginate biosynthesis protein Alg44 n=1 Tax=Halomonas litopenaei TaxID=2109328 RepID=A0ABX5IV94_9GAMM|nr:MULTISPECIES: PilZ domain-containing protein [Halomonas]PTL89245.1 alginate biosynthesis protein Alg44 [Halomonas litopenaei]PTL89511.1 alginate biosynthesis protein Alg44 [Halomonas sp. SYSU XM8]
MSDYFDDKDTSTPRHEPARQPDPAPRAEPHLGDARSQPRQEEAPAGSGLAHERRDERRYIRVSPTFEVRFDDGNRFRGLDLSQGGFAIESPRPMRQDARVRGSIAITTASGELLVPVSAQCRHSLALEGRGGAHHAGFEITDISPSHLELLRRVVRAHLAGRPLDVEQMVQGEDAQTPRKRRGTGSTPQAAARPPRPMGRYVALFIGFAVLAVVAAATAYRNFMLIEPNFAAVTAPRIDIRAPSPGILMAHELKAGDRVTRDERLTRVKDVDLESDLILAEAAQRYNSQLIENLQENLDGANGGQVSLANSAEPGNGDAVSFETVSPDIARARIDQFETARDFQASRVTALQARQSQNEIYSPCDCLVAWALSSSDGTYINESEKIMTLMRTGDDEVMVEALVHMDDIDRIEPDQLAYLSLPNASGPISARVRSVALDIERQPRAGFPSWVRQQQNVASVLLVPEKPLPVESVGTPVDVRFTEQALLGATAEWIWQSGRRVVQQASQLFSGIGDNDTADTAG